MKKLIFTLFLIIPILALAQPESDAIFEKVIKEYTLNEDGSIDFHYYKKLKLLTHYSFNRLYGETFIIYNPEFQSLTINKSLTTQEDGNVVQAPANAFNELLPRFASIVAAYNQLREMAVTHTGLELNAVIELDYTIHTEAGYYPAMMSNEVISESSPIAEKQIIIHLPADHELNYKVYNVRTSPKVSKKKGISTYVFTFKGIAEKSHESFRPHYQSDLPALSFSTMNMDKAYQYLSSLEALNYKTDEKMKSAVAEIIKDSKSDFNTIMEIQKLVVNNLNTYNIPFQYTGFNGRPAIETWMSNGGTAFEKSILLTTLLLEAGINAEPVITIPTAHFNESIGCLNQIDNFGVQVNPRETEQLYLSVTSLSDQNMIYKMGDLKVISLNLARPMRLENIETNLNSVSLAGNLVFDDSLKVNGKLEMELFYAANPYFKLKEDTAYAKRLLKGFPSKDIDKAGILNCAQSRSTVNYEIAGKSPVTNHADYYFFEIPESSRGSYEWHMQYLNFDRKTDLEIPFTISENYDITLVLPEGVNLVDQPEKIGRQTDFGKLSIEISKSGNEIRIIRSLEITAKTITVSAYEDFKEMIDLWNEKRFRQLIFKK